MFCLNVTDSDNIEKHSFQPCVTLAIKNQKYEKVDCYALGVLGVCLVDSKLFDKNLNIYFLLTSDSS